MSNIYPPTEEKVSQLRSEGVFPYSKSLDTFLIISTLLVILIFFFNSVVVEIHSFANDMISNPQSPFESIATFFSLFVKAVSLFVFPICFVRLLSTLIQSKFLFSFSFLGFNFDKIFIGISDYLSNLVKALISFLGNLIVVTFLFLIFFFVVQGLILEEHSVYDKVLGNDYSYVLREKLQKLLLSVKEFSIFLLVFIMVAAIISKIFVLMSFKREHAMSREEFEED